MGSSSFANRLTSSASSVASGFSDIATSTLQELTSSQLSQLNPSQVASRIGDFTAQQIRSLSQGQLAGVNLEQIKPLIVKYGSALEEQLLDEINNSQNGLFASGLIVNAASILNQLTLFDGVAFASLEGYIQQEIKDMPGLLNGVTATLKVLSGANTSIPAVVSPNQDFKCDTIAALSVSAISRLTNSQINSLSAAQALSTTHYDKVKSSAIRLKYLQL